MREDQKLCTDCYEARVIQVGEVQPQWTVVVVDWNARLFIRTGHEGGKGMFHFEGFKTIEAAKRAAEDALLRHDPQLDLEDRLWQKGGQ